MSELENQTSKELFDTGKEAIERLSGFKIELKAGFDYTGNLKITKAVKPKPLKGITFPENFRYRTLTDATDLNDLMSTWTDFCDEVLDEEVIAFWKPLLKPKNTQNSSSLTAYTSMLLKAESANIERYGIGEVVQNCTSIHPDQLPIGVIPEAFLPEKSWFKPQLHEIELKDIFTILPDAERELFALCLGRAMVGCSGTQHLESDHPIRHTFRTICLMYGRDPGQGKSNLFQRFLEPAIKHVGFLFSNFVTLYEKYGLGSIAESAMSYKDDLSSDELLDNLRAKHIKTLASGGNIRVEDKYIASYEAIAKTVIFANVNHFDLNKVSQMDEGVLSRLVILKTHSNTDLANWVPTGASVGSKSPMTEAHLHFLAEKYDVDLMTLALWALRLCADEFMKYVPKGKPTNGRNILADKMKGLAKELAVQINHSLMAKNTCILLQFASKLRGGKEMTNVSINNLQTSLYDGAYLAIAKDLEPVREMIQEHWLANHKPENHPWIALENIRKASLVNAIEKLNVVAKGTNNKDIHEAVKAMFSAITTTSGFKITYSSVKVIDAWGDSITEVNNLKELVGDILSVTDLDILKKENVAPTISVDIENEI